MRWCDLYGTQEQDTAKGDAKNPRTVPVPAKEKKAGIISEGPKKKFVNEVFGVNDFPMQVEEFGPFVKVGQTVYLRYESVTFELIGHFRDGNKINDTLSGFQPDDPRLYIRRNIKPKGKESSGCYLYDFIHIPLWLWGCEGDEFKMKFSGKEEGGKKRKPRILKWRIEGVDVSEAELKEYITKKTYRKVTFKMMPVELFVQDPTQESQWAMIPNWAEKGEEIKEHIIFTNNNK